MSNRLTPSNLKVLKSGGTYVVGSVDFWNNPVFGSDRSIDQIELHVYDLDDNLLKSSRISDFEIASSGNVILKPGDDLRKIGLLSGEYKVNYNFFRNVAGSNDIILVETTPTNYGNVYSGPPSITGHGERPYWINDDGVIFKGQKGDTGAPEELDIRELKYFIQAISPSRKEIRLAPLDIKLEKYKNDFAKLYITDRTYTANHDGGMGRLTLQDSSTFEFTVGSYISQDEKIHPNMIGGTLRIEKAFITKYNITQTALNILNSSMIEPEYDWSSTGLDWDSSLQSDAVKPNLGWSTGYSSWVQSPGIGYHAMWVEGEGKDGKISIKFIDKNSEYSQPHRQLSVFNSPMESLASKGISAGDIIRITWNQKSNANKYIKFRMKYKPYFVETQPTVPPTGFVDRYTETKPTDAPLGFTTGIIPTADFIMTLDGIPTANFIMTLTGLPVASFSMNI